MEQNDISYEVRYLLNGEENTRLLEAGSAAAAQELVRMQEVGVDDDFELIQVQIVEETPGSPENV